MMIKKTKFLNPINIELSYAEWGVPCKEVWSADIIEHTETSINKWLKEKIATMIKFDEPLDRYNLYINGEFVERLSDLITIKKLL